MPPTVGNNRMLPGKQGVDYHFVSFGGKVYVVYRTKLPNGGYVNMSWRVSQSDYKAYGINPGATKSINSATFHSLQYFGDAGEITAGPEMSNIHPFQTYLKKLQDQNGHVSWLKDKQFVATMLMGFAEGWTSTELNEKLQSTHWYQSRTQQQRAWELDLSKKDRTAAIQSTSARLDEYLRELYGPDYNLNKVMTKEEKNAWAKQIASGKYGNSEDGFAIWQQEARAKAEGVEGTPAWIDREKIVEGQRDFMNRPEDMYQQITEQAREWLGPAGMPADDTLKRWSNLLVTEKRSDADWSQFLEERAQRMYPWLAKGETWQEFADPYRRKAEDLLGRPVAWNDKYLQGLGALDANGTPTGKAQTFQEWDLNLRKTNDFWSSPTANDEGYTLLNRLNETFNGVTA